MQNKQKMLDENFEKQRWNPPQPQQKTHLSKTNWSVGNSNNFDGLSMNKNDFQNHGSMYDPMAKAKRMELVNELRKSNLPMQNFGMPKSTAQESFGAAKAASKDAMKQRKEEADKIFERVRGAKPNFTMGSHKLDYMSENKGSLRQPGLNSIDKEGIE